MSGVELERFSLKFRQETLKGPKFRQLRYFLSQEAGAAGLLAYEVTGVRQFGKGRKHPLKINLNSLEKGLNAAMTTSIIAGSGSALELASNLWTGAKRSRAGYGAGTARNFVIEKLNKIDSLLAEHRKLVENNKDHPDYKRAMAECEIFAEMRKSFVDEFSHFYVDNRGTKAFQNTFFTLNAAYNAVGATAAGYGAKSLHAPKYTGTSNVLFIISGALAMVTPTIAGVTSRFLRSKAKRELEPLSPAVSDPKKSEMAAKLKVLEEMLPDSQGTLIPTLSATKRFGLYETSRDLFDTQLNSEVKTIRRLDKIALETDIMAPPIGGLLMTQGILGTVGYYRYPKRIRKQLNLNYQGAILGTVGSSITLAGNAAWLLSSMAYQYRLKKNQELPSQLIEKRLEHLDEIEKVIQAI